MTISFGPFAFRATKSTATKRPDLEGPACVESGPPEEHHQAAAIALFLRDGHLYAGRQHSCDGDRTVATAPLCCSVRRAGTTTEDSISHRARRRRTAGELYSWNSENNA